MSLVIPNTYPDFLLIAMASKRKIERELSTPLYIETAERSRCRVPVEKTSGRCRG
jgi:hypothetical protein